MQDRKHKIEKIKASLKDAMDSINYAMLLVESIEMEDAENMVSTLPEVR